jgi:hypothetical protein
VPDRRTIHRSSAPRARSGRPGIRPDRPRARRNRVRWNWARRVGVRLGNLGRRRGARRPPIPGCSATSHSRGCSRPEPRHFLPHLRRIDHRSSRAEAEYRGPGTRQIEHRRGLRRAPSARVAANAPVPAGAIRPVAAREPPAPSRPRHPRSRRSARRPRAAARPLGSPQRARSARARTPDDRNRRWRRTAPAANRRARHRIREDGRPVPYPIRSRLEATA